MTATTTATLGDPRRASRRRDFGVALEPWTYLAPSLVLIGAVMFVPLLLGLSFAFRKLELLNPFAQGWAGLDNFARLLDDRYFTLSLVNTAWWTGASLALQFLLGLGLALLLSRDFAGRRLIQALVFLPWAVPTFLSGLNWAWLFNPVIGPLPHWMAGLGLLDEPYNILSNPAVAMWGPIVANVWFGIPFFAITLMAALQAIPGDLYEAAAIDGATPLQRFLRITLPFLAPMIAITVLLRTIWIANFADLIVVMTGGGPANATQTISSYIFTTAYRGMDFGYASAIATVLLLLLLLYAALLLRIRNALPKTT
ncbi:MAG: carbohydrate ABC transporter permease [Alphaproteobacteria bacterium]